MTWTKRYSTTGKELGDAIEPRMNADEPTPKMLAKRSKLKRSTTVAVVGA